MSRESLLELELRQGVLFELREERGGVDRIAAAQAHSAACFAAARVNAVAALARCARLRNGSGRKVWHRKDGAE